MVTKTPINSTPVNDFKAEELIKNVEGHAKEIVSLTTRIESLEGKFGDNEKLAETIENCCTNAVKMQNTFSNEIKRAILKEQAIKDEIKNLVDRIDRNYFIASIKRFGRSTWLVLIYFAGLITKWGFDKIFPH